jgi:hypothetical protein
VNDSSVLYRYDIIDASLGCQEVQIEVKSLGVTNYKKVYYMYCIPFAAAHLTLLRV